MSEPLDRLKYHVTGAIERGEKTAVVSTEAEKMKCSACGIDSWHDICLSCVRARARVACGSKRCSCPKALKRERVIKTASRSWVACDRCLGSVRQLS